MVDDFFDENKELLIKYPVLAFWLACQISIIGIRALRSFITDPLDDKKNQVSGGDCYEDKKQ